MPHLNRAVILLGLILVGCATATTTPPKKSSPESQALYEEIAALDRQMFEAFNAHDIEKVSSYFDDRLEFYHDTGGLLSLSDAADGMRSNFEKDNGLRRDLIEGSLEVYPIRGYGAIQVGEHRFCHKEKGVDDCGVFKFLHVWQKQPGGWKITRAVSYDH